MNRLFLFHYFYVTFPWCLRIQSAIGTRSGTDWAIRYPIIQWRCISANSSSVVREPGLNSILRPWLTDQPLNSVSHATALMPGQTNSLKSEPPAVYNHPRWHRSQPLVSPRRPARESLQYLQPIPCPTR